MIKKYKSKYKYKLTESANVIEGDLSELRGHELSLLATLLILLSENKMSKNSKKYIDDIKSWGFNKNSGYVFLVDDNYNVFMKNGNELDIFLSLPYSGEEGFPDDFNNTNEDNFHEEDIEFLNNFGRFINGKYKAND